MKSELKLTIAAIASCTVNLSEGETVDDVKNRFVDIYLHDAGEEGYFNKTDLGAYSYLIATADDDQPVIVPRGLLLALINTVKDNTDLENVYDDENGTSYSWEEVNRVLNAG